MLIFLNNVFMKLEIMCKIVACMRSIFQISGEKKEAYEDLAMNIFMKYSPKDSRSNRAECTNCETMIPDW